MLRKATAMKSNRREKWPSVDTAASFGFKDETVKRPWMASQRLVEVSAHKVVLSHPCDHDIGTSMHSTCGRQLMIMKVQPSTTQPNTKTVK